MLYNKLTGQDYLSPPNACEYYHHRPVEEIPSSVSRAADSLRGTGALGEDINYFIHIFSQKYSNFQINDKRNKYMKSSDKSKIT